MSAETPPVKVVYIGGFGRSGSTLLAYLLGALPGFASVGELKTIWQAGLVDDELCGCGAPFSRCPFWRETGEVAFGGWDHVDAHEMVALDARVCGDEALPRLLLRSSGSYRADFDRYSHVRRELLRAVCTVARCEFVVDSTKLPMDALVLARAEGIDCKVIHLTRDSRGVAFSKAKTKFRNPAVRTGTAYMLAYGPRHTAIRWTYNSLFFELASLAGVHRARMSYEDLVADPPREVERALSKLGIAHDGQTLGRLAEGAVELGAQHTLRGNPMRFQSGSQRIKLDDTWRTQMSRLDCWSVIGITWPLLVAYGYLARGL